jgi:hypothetical protein
VELEDLVALWEAYERRRGGKSSMNNPMLPFLIWDALVFLIAISGIAAGICFFRVLRKAK